MRILTAKRSIHDGYVANPLALFENIKYWMLTTWQVRSNKVTLACIWSKPFIRYMISEDAGASKLNVAFSDDDLEHNEGHSTCRQQARVGRGKWTQLDDPVLDWCLQVIYKSPVRQKSQSQECLKPLMRSGDKPPSQAAVLPTTLIGGTSLISSIGDFLLLSCHVMQKPPADVTKTNKEAWTHSSYSYQQKLISTAQCPLNSKRHLTVDSNKIPYQIRKS